MDLGLNDKVALVTGGSKGIGLACARTLAAEGARVAIAARDAERLHRAAAELAREGHAVHVVCADLSDAAAAKTMLAQVEDALGPVDVLVNSAGAARRTPPSELDAEHWHAAMHAKYFPYVHAMQAVITSMAARGGGAIVNVVGTGGKLASPTHVPGGAANAALMLASAGLAHAFASKGIRINVVNPGLTATDRLYEGLAAQARMSGETVNAVLERQTRALPMGRVASAQEVANVVAFLASSAASHVSAAIVTVDGAATPIVI